MSAIVRRENGWAGAISAPRVPREIVRWAEMARRVAAAEAALDEALRALRSATTETERRAAVDACDAAREAVDRVLRLYFLAAENARALR